MTSARPTRLRTVLPAVVALAVLSGCGAGMVTQTDTQVAAVNGASGRVGLIDVREAQLAFPASGTALHPAGSDAELMVALINSGDNADSLVSITSPAATQVVVSGTRDLPGHTAVSSELVPGTVAPVTDGHATTEPHGQPGHPTSTPSSGPPTVTLTPLMTTTSAAPTSGSPAPTSVTGTATRTTTGAAPFGRIRVVLTGLRWDVRAGENVPVTFLFRNSGELRLSVPIAAPDNPRIDNPVHREAKAGH